MEISNIYLIFNTDEFTKEDIIRDIKDEGYQHNFMFGNIMAHPRNKDGYEQRIRHIRQCDEVWLFGHCDDIIDYKIAKELGMDCWQMA